jgi:hypothetical protein
MIHQFKGSHDGIFPISLARDYFESLENTFSSRHANADICLGALGFDDTITVHQIRLANDANMNNSADCTELVFLASF